MKPVEDEPSDNEINQKLFTQVYDDSEVESDADVVETEVKPLDTEAAEDADSEKSSEALSDGEPAKAP